MDTLLPGTPCLRLLPFLPQGQLAEVKDVSPWDGQDAKEEVVDEFSLDDLMNEEL